MSRPESRPGTPHESAWLHVTGQAIYVDDTPVQSDELHVAVGYSEHSHAKISGLALDAVRSFPGVVDVITVDDVPGDADIGPVFAGDPLFAGHTAEFYGQPLFAVAAESFRVAQQAVAKVRVSYEPLTPILDLKQADAEDSLVLPRREFLLGDADEAISSATHTLQTELYVGGQEHFYLEGQACVVWPGEDRTFRVLTSSQSPADIQELCARVLGIAAHRVVVEVRRMGGGFGGKESQAAGLVCIAAIFADRLQRCVRYRMPRRNDMVQTGKRHDFLHLLRAGFDEQGVVKGMDARLLARCGYSVDLSEGVVDRAMFHADNAYSLGAARIIGVPCKTHTVSNTAFRGFGAPQGVMLAELLMDDIAYGLKLDPLDVRLRNLYRPGATATPYGQDITDFVTGELISRLAESSQYRARRADIEAFNSTHDARRRGIALIPVKFGVSFTTNHLNQGGALVHIYTDGSVQVSHGGTEMGQGLNSKVQAAVADAFGVPLAQVICTATRTDKVANSSPTAASAGTDLNGMAALAACDNIKAGLAAFAKEKFGVEEIRFADGQVHAGGVQLTFAQFCEAAYLARVPLWSSGFYKTPDIHFDKKARKGTPFYYFACGAAVAEVEINIRTGTYQVGRIDVLHDVGHSINPAIDLGQVEGGVIQGLGWLTTEELDWDDTGKPLATGPANYKIPSVLDLPTEFNVELAQEPNPVRNVMGSKAVGEPPLVLAISVWSALRHAIASLVDYERAPRLDTPATPERVLDAIESLSGRAHQ